MPCGTAGSTRKKFGRWEKCRGRKRKAIKWWLPHSGDQGWDMILFCFFWLLLLPPCCFLWISVQQQATKTNDKLILCLTIKFTFWEQSWRIEEFCMTKWRGRGKGGANKIFIQDILGQTSCAMKIPTLTLYYMWKWKSFPGNSQYNFRQHFMIYI